MSTEHDKRREQISREIREEDWSSFTPVRRQSDESLQRDIDKNTDDRKKDNK